MGMPRSAAGSGRLFKQLAWWLLGLAAVTRLINALGYKTRLGFDAVENVEYIERLMHSWALPAPDAAWATSHPPLFYYFFAALGRAFATLGQPEVLLKVIPLLGGMASLATAWLASSLVRRMYPEQELRALIALALVLFLPVQIYLSAMVNEEVMATLLASAALWLAVVPAASGRPHERSLARTATIGLLAGLALLTKLSGLLVVAGIAGAWWIQGWRERSWGYTTRRIFLMGTVALCVGGWFYIRNYFQYGYFYPQDLDLHAIMFEMPPGARGLLDYLWFPLATWTDPQLLNSDLLESVWGSTYATLYFDGHRHFLAHSTAVSRMGTALLILGLLPVAAFARGLYGGIRRTCTEKSSAELPLLSLVALSLVGYVGFTWNNPWFVTLKAGYMLSLSLPFAWYASETLARWSSQPGARRWIIWAWLFALGTAVTLSFTNGLIFEKLDGPGLPWRATLETP